ncbi:MAG: FxsA family protein [Rubricoccaceae bacterium]|nr:FxsA family protein [Rubricoccaceae bacterium]
MRSNWLGRLFALFLIVPILELVLLIQIGEWIGFWPTIGLIVLTAAVGSWLARREGWNAFRRFQQKLSTGGVPGREITDGLIILVSGALLLTPGIITDAVGFLGLLPPSRTLIRKQIEKRFQRSVRSGRTSVFVVQPPGAFSEQAPPIEDAEVVDEP